MKTKTVLPKFLLACLAIALLATGNPTSAQGPQKRAMTFMDVMEMRSVGGADVAPDGRRVVYTISIPHWKSGKKLLEAVARDAGRA